MHTATASLTNAAESLLEDLAGESVGTSLPLDATQEELNMSRPLVYMTGLIVVVTGGSDGPSSPPFTKEQKALFQRFQTLYHEGGSRQHETLYELSPTLLPCEAARKEIQQAVEQRVKEIEVQSANVAKELLLEAEQLKAKNTKKSKTTTKQKGTSQSRSAGGPASSPEKEDDACKDDDEHMVRPPCESKSKSKSLTALFLRQRQSTSFDEDDADESGSWMEVTKKSKKPVEALAVSTSVEGSKILEEEQDNVEHSCYVAPSLPTLEAEELPATAKMTLAKKPLGAPALQQHHAEEEVETKKEPLEINNTETNTSPLTLQLVHTPAVYRGNDPTFDTLQQWQARIIQHLESELDQKNQEYQEERTAHTKALALEKEISNERLQSLQLRLYISETRLKTFEDALEQHVQAVANNTAPTSPERRRLRRPEEQATSTTTPLLARVQEMNREG
jgi:hypothetical protein